MHERATVQLLPFQLSQLVSCCLCIVTAGLSCNVVNQFVLVLYPCMQMYSALQASLLLLSANDNDEEDAWFVVLHCRQADKCCKSVHDGRQ